MIWRSVRLMVAATTVGWLLVAGVVSLRAALPAGTYLAYNVWYPAGLSIYLLDLERGLAQNIIPQPVAVGPPMWSPNGQLLAFEGRYQGGSSIYVMDVFGGNLRMVSADHAGNQFTPVWFADSAGLYFRQMSNDEGHAYRVNLDGTGLASVEIINYEYLIPRRHDPANPIVMGSQDNTSGIFLARGRDAALQRLVTTDINFREHPQRSPDQHQIALVTWGDSTEIYLMNADGSAFRQITRDGLFKSNLTWRP